MKAKVEPVAENEVMLAIEVPHDDVKAKIERTVRRLNEETSLPGFRKGRAPRELIVQRYGNDYILAETLNEFLPEWYGDAVDEAAIEPVSSPEIDLVGDFTGEGDFAFTAKVQVRPEPVLGEYKGLEVPRREVEVTEAQVDAQLAMLQERLATLKPVEGRAVANGDFAQIDFEGAVDGEALEGGSATDYMLQVGFGNLIPGFEEALVGVDAGGTAEFDLAFPDDYHAENLQGKPVHFSATVKEIKEKVVPELDDEFAKEASEFETLDELRADVRERLQKMQEAAVEREFRGRVVDQVVENATVTIPAAMIERQAHSLYHELEHTVGERGMEMTEYLAAIEKTKEEVEEELQPRAESIVKQGLVLAAIRDIEEVEVGDDEVRDYLTQEAEYMQRDAGQHILEQHASGRAEHVRDELVMAKTVELLVESAIPVELTEDDESNEPADDGE